MNSTTLSATYTRPANTTQYTANDALSDSTTAPTALTFGPASDVRANGWLVGARCIDSVTGATLPQLRLFLFNASPTAINDNAAFTLSDALALTCIGYLDFITFVTIDDTGGGSLNSISIASVNQPIAVNQTLYGLVKVLNAYTPISAEVFTWYLDIDTR